MKFSPALLLCVSTTICAGDGGLLDPSEIIWEPLTTICGGAMIARLDGDRSKAMPFTIRLKLFAGSKIPPHWHQIVEHFTVISGTFLLGHGDKFEESKLRPLPPGSFATMPAGHRHHAMVKEETVVQIHGVGPWSISYVAADGDRCQAR